MGKAFWAIVTIIAVGVALGTLMAAGFGVIYSVVVSRFDSANARFESVGARGASSMRSVVQRRRGSSKRRITVSWPT